MPNGNEQISSSLNVSKEAPPLQTMDYALLREKGLAYIRQLASESWTDHNIHDPGITILEALCYTLTDLGFRTNQEMTAILTNEEGRLDIAAQGFFPSEEILPNAPLTLLDFRKLLIDQEGIRNAWLTLAEEISPPLYFDEDANEISFEAGAPLSLKGLYDILLEFQEDELNSNLFSRELPTINGTDYRIEVTALYWDELPSSRGYGLEVDAANIQLLGGAGDELTEMDPANYNDYLAALSVPYLNSGHVDQLPLRIKVFPAIEPADRPALEGAIIAELERADEFNLAVEFNQRVERTIAIIRRIQKAFNANRNLCEDVYRFRTVRTQEIALEGDIEVLPGADIQRILEEIYRAVDDFLSPRVHFYTLTEMLAKGYSLSEIFEGPRLQSGFIDSYELIGNERLDKASDQIIYVSDLFRIIVELNEAAGAVPEQRILSIKNLRISNYINNQRIADGVQNCLKLNLSDTYKPKLSAGKSAIRFFQDGTLVEDDSLSEVGIPEDIPGRPVTDITRVLPEGMLVDLETYYSLQNDFPLVYGIGKEGLDENTTEKRRALARQLKAYLAVFEQILANYLSQLAHVRRLFSIDPNQPQTYFHQPLYEVPGIAPILRDFTWSGQTWPDFIQHAENTYRRLLDAIAETRPVFLDRRNRLLSHLLARFGDDLSELSRLSMSLAQKSAADAVEAAALKRLAQARQIRNKARMLGRYPLVSGSRGQGFDYHRNSLLIIQEEGGGPTLYRWALRTSEDMLLLSAVSAEADPDAALDNFVDIFPLLIREELYDIHPTGGGDMTFDLLDELGGVAVANSARDFPTTEEAEDGVDEIIALISELCGVWDTFNVSGMQRRIAHHLGLKSEKQRNLIVDPADYFTIDNPAPGEFLVMLFDSSGVELLASDPANPFPDANAAQTAIDRMIELGVDEENFEIIQPSPGVFSFRLLDETTVLGESSVVYPSSAEALNARDRTALFIYEKFSRQGLFIVEHILLRPYSNQPQPLIPVFLDNEDHPAMDPYSFRVSVILPSGFLPGDPETVTDPRRFADRDFRSHAARVIRMEAPAHVAVNIFWLDEDQLAVFESAYRRWLIVSSVFPENRLSELDAFLQVLNPIIDRLTP